MGMTAFRQRERRALERQGAPIPPRPETPDEHIARLRADNADLRRKLAATTAQPAAPVVESPEPAQEREQPQQPNWQKPKRRG